MKSDYSFESFGKQDYKLGFIQEHVEMIAYCLVCFFVPFFIGHPQQVVGVAVNAALVLAALNLKSVKVLPVIILPSLAVLSRGVIFGPFTYFLVLMIPFIWLGNTILVYAFKRFAVDQKKNKVLALVIGAAAKTAFLFSAAFVLFKIGALPAIFLTTMGLFQLYTALAGGALALGIHTIKKKLQI